MLYIIGIIIALIIIVVLIYNGLVKARMYANEALSQIDVQLKRRNDLIPNLVETVKGAAKFEQNTLEKVISLRNQITEVKLTSEDPTKNADVMQLSDQLSGALKSLFAVSEAYPDLKANQQYQSLMEELTSTENKIAYSRQLFNSQVANYNTKIQVFPSNIIAGLFNFKAYEFLETPKEEKKVPTVNFGDTGLG